MTTFTKGVDNAAKLHVGGYVQRRLRPDSQSPRVHGLQSISSLRLSSTDSSWKLWKCTCTVQTSRRLLRHMPSRMQPTGMPLASQYGMLLEFLHSLISLGFLHSMMVMTVQDFGSYCVLADIGGGYGQLVMDIMDTNPGGSLPAAACHDLILSTGHHTWHSPEAVADSIVARHMTCPQRAGCCSTVRVCKASLMPSCLCRCAAGHCAGVVCCGRHGSRSS